MARQLRVTLTPDQRDLLSEFVSLNLGKRSVTTTASVCMTAGSPLIPRGTERWGSAMHRGMGGVVGIFAHWGVRYAHRSYKFPVG